MKDELKETDLWLLYDRGKTYNRMIHLYENTQNCNNFYLGKQWIGLNSETIAPVCYNIIEPIVNHKVATINQNLWEIKYSSDNFDDLDNLQIFKEACDLLNKRVARVWERDQMDYKIHLLSKDAAIVGEGVVYVDYDSETDDPINEIINNTDVCYGNENSSDIQSQPYIIIKLRRPVEKLRELARSKGVSEEEIQNITTDQQVYEEASELALQEVNDMCTLLIKLYKKDGKVYFEKATKNVVIQKNSNSGLTSYPLAHNPWPEVKGSARGMGEVLPLIPNQIEINKTLMRRLLIVKLHAYPKNVINTKVIENSSDANKVGATLKVNDGTVDDVRKAFTTITPTNMSSDANLIQEEMISKTRELKNASELATGNVDPSKASGKAIVAVQHASNLPLGEYTLSMKKLIEDLGRIYLDMWSAYAENGLKVIDKKRAQENKEQEYVKNIAIDVLKQLKATVKVDITPTSSYDKIAVEQSLENLLTGKYIDFEEYATALDNGSVMPKTKLLDMIKIRKEKEQQIQQMKLQANDMIQSANKVLDATDQYNQQANQAAVM